ncbi:FecCD family ABC transporter permease [Paenibacillus terrae]|uniref:Iron ABC transporter permease n=1 Tax=Paenibacillus terrae TaxID=159743 RepID=A0A0D7WZT5_9BACL|nr:iron ABC transporter permease [Paenibacillus terrae]
MSRSLGTRDARRSKAWLVCLVLAGISFVVIVLGLNTGTIRIPPLRVLDTLFGGGSGRDHTVLFEYRLPRIVVTVLAGAGLGAAGAVMQGLSRNALADPGVLGLHAGAALGLVMFVSFFRDLEGSAAVLIPLFTFAGGVVAAVLIVLLSYNRNRGIVPVRLILSGIGVASGLSAITLYWSLRLDEDTYAFTARWLAGSVWGRDWIHAAALLPWIVIVLPYVLSQTRSLNNLSLGDETAAGIGTSVKRQRLLLLGAAVALSSASVSMAGGIGFIGLIAPHLARRLVGPMYQHLLPVACFVGIVILVTADTIGRSVFQPNAIPAGVVVAVVGAPYFLFLLSRTK